MSNPGPASVVTQNLSFLTGQVLSASQVASPTQDILLNQTVIYQGPNGALYQSNGSSLSFVGGLAQAAASTSLVLDSIFRQYSPLTVGGVVALTVSGTTLGASAAMVVISNGVNIPSVSGADAWATDFGYLNTAGYPNRIDVWYDGIAARYAWSQQAVPAVVPVAPSFSVAPVINGTPTQGASGGYTTGTFSGVPTPTSSQQWTLNGVDIAGAASTTYTPLAGDVGKTLAVRQIATNASGAASSTSAGVVVAAASAFESETLAWLARVATNSGTVSSPTQSAVNSFVVSAKAAGYFTKFRRISIPVGDALAAVVPLVNTSGATVDTNTGSLSYAESTGFVTSGANYLATGYTPSEATGGLSIYLRTTQTSVATGKVAMGARDSGSTQIFRLIANADGSGGVSAGGVAGAWGGVVGASNVQPATTGGMTAGMWNVTRTSSTLSTLYKNGTSVGTMATATTPATTSNALYVGCNNGAGTAGAFLDSGSAIGAYAVDTGLTGTDAANFYTHMQTLQTALSRNV